MKSIFPLGNSLVLLSDRFDGTYRSLHTAYLDAFEDFLVHHDIEKDMVLVCKFFKLMTGLINLVLMLTLGAFCI